MKRIIGIVLFCFITTSVCYAKDFIVLSEVGVRIIGNGIINNKYEYYKKKILIDKDLILYASIDFFDNGNIQVTAIYRKSTEFYKTGKIIYVYETPEEVYKLLKEVGKWKIKRL